MTNFLYDGKGGLYDGFRRISVDGKLTGLEAHLNNLQGMVLDAAGDLYIAEIGNQRVRKIATDGTLSTVAGNGKLEHSGDGGLAIDAGLSSPGELALDPQGNLYIGGQQGGRLRKVSKSGIISTVAYLGFSRPIAVDAAGTLASPPSKQ
jgi:hypothetical protein